MIDITCRKAISVDDRAACLNIRHRVFVEEQKVPIEEEIDEWEGSAIHFLASIEKTPVATGRIRIKKSFIKFERIATLPEYRGKKVGKALMQYITSYAREHYPHHLPAMHAQLSACSFYEKQGWVVIGNTFLEAEIEHVVMVLLPENPEHLKGLACLHDPETPPNILLFLQEKASFKIDVPRFSG